MSNEGQQHPRYHQNRRLQQAKMQRQVRKSQRRLNQLRALWKMFITIGLICIGVFVLKMPQWRLHSNAFDSLNSPALEIVNNRIVPSQKILSALRRNQVPLKPIFMVKTDNLKKSIMQLDPIQDVYIRRFWFPARIQIIIIERTPAITIAPDEKVAPIAFFSSDGKLIGRDYMPLSSDFKVVRVITYGSGDDYRNPQDVYVKITTANIRLGSFNAGTYEKIHRLPSLLPQVKMLNKKVKYIDLRWDSNYIKLDE